MGNFCQICAFEGMKNPVKSFAFHGKTLCGIALELFGVEPKSQHLGHVGHDGEGVGIDFLHDAAQGGNLSAVDDAYEHRMGLLGVHTDGRERRDAAAELAHQRLRHFFGLVGDDSEFPCRLEAVEHGFVGLAFYVRFERRHHDGEQSHTQIDLAVGVVSGLEHEQGRADDDAVEAEDRPCDGVGVDFLLNHDCRDVRTPRTAADLKGERHGRADANPGCQRRKNFCTAFAERDLEVLNDGQTFPQEHPEGLQTDIQNGENGEPLFDDEEGKRHERQVEPEQHEGLRNQTVGSDIDQNGDTAHAADGEFVGGDEGVRRRGDQKGGEHRV